MGMRWLDWKFSARLGWEDPWLRWISVSALVIVLAMGAFFLWRLLPEGWRSGVVTMHYNIYIGIDDVRTWQWLFFVPGTAFLFVLLDTVIALGLFRRHPLASRTLVATGLMTAVVWAIGSFFLINVNI